MRALLFFRRRGSFFAQSTSSGTNWKVVQSTSPRFVRRSSGRQARGIRAMVMKGEVLGTVPLPIAGLMNDKSAEEMSALVESLEESWKQIGCSMPSPFMTMALIPLACLPELRLTNRGLVDCTTFRFVPLEV